MKVCRLLGSDAICDLGRRSSRLPPLFLLRNSRLFRHVLQAAAVVSMCCASGWSANPGLMRHITVEEGLSQSSVNCMAQDSQGFIWLGTNEGLNRYDGYSFRSFKFDPLDSNSLPNNRVQTLCVASNGQLWAGTKAGLWRLLLKEGKPERARLFSRKGNERSIDILAIHADNRGRLWVGTNGSGLFCLDTSLQVISQFLPDSKNANSIPSSIVSAIHPGSDDVLWIGTRGGGLSQLTISRGHFLTHRNNPKNPLSLKDNWINDLAGGKTDTLWVATQNGLDMFSTSGGTFSHFDRTSTPPLSGRVITSLGLDGEGNLWIGTLSDGFDVLNKERNHIRRAFVAARGENEEKVFSLSILVDRSECIWLGTGGDGVYVMDTKRRPFHSFGKGEGPYELPHSQVWSVMEDHINRVLWIGTGSGVVQYDKRLDKRFVHSAEVGNPRRLQSSRILAMAMDKEQSLWFGGFGGGISKRSPLSGRFVTRSTDVFSFVFCLFPRPDGTVWVGTYDGLLRVDRGLEIAESWSTSSSKRITHNHVLAVKESRDGSIWVGTYHGLNMLRPGVDTAIVYLPDPRGNGLSNGTVLSLCEDWSDTSHVMWVGTNGGGLNRLDIRSRRFEHYTTNDGLPNNVVYGVLRDDDGRLWLSTNKGLSRFDPVRREFKNFDKSDGLQGDEFSQGAYSRSASGRMYFGGVYGFTTFHPDSIRDNLYIPPVVITSFRVFDVERTSAEEISFANEITLSSDDRVFSMEFASLDFSEPKKNRYAYKLEGFDPDWTYSGSRRYVSYTNLDHGEYVFRAKGTNRDGVWNDAGRSLRIVILPPYWATWWFRALMVISLAGVAYGGWRLRNWYAEYRREHYLSHFRLVRKLGAGGMSEVYQARNTISGKTVALKILHPRLTESEAGRARFQREGRIMTTMTHPHIVKIYETGEASGRGYISMELLHGMSLLRHLKDHGPLQAAEILPIFKPVAEALLYIHDIGVVHRDVKPENIMVPLASGRSTSGKSNSEERVRLMDFGLARSAEHLTITTGDGILGTIAYMSPEQARGLRVDRRSDVYSLGVTMYESISGKLPYEAATEWALLQALAQGPSVVPSLAGLPGVPQPLAGLVMDMMEPDPAKRPQDMAEVIERLATIAPSINSDDRTRKTSAVEQSTASLTLARQGDIQNALRVSTEAVKHSESDMDPMSAEKIYWNHSKVLASAGQNDEADRYYRIAFERFITRSIGEMNRDLSMSVSADSSGVEMMLRRETDRWRALYRDGKAHHDAAKFQEARDRLVDAVVSLRTALMLIDPDRRREYLETSGANNLIALADATIGKARKD